MSCTKLKLVGENGDVLELSFLCLSSAEKEEIVSFILGKVYVLWLLSSLLSSLSVTPSDKYLKD